MRFFAPKLAPGWLENGPPTSPQDHFGGWPWGLPPQRWPACRECGARMSFVCQLEHHPERLKLGGKGRVMFVFWCLSDLGMCEVWEPEAGANAVLVLSPEERTDSAAEAADVEVLPYLRVHSWTEGDDGVPPRKLKAFFDYERNLEEGELWDVSPGTRLGGAPFWPSAAPACDWDADWKLALQLAGWDWLEAPVPSADELGCTVTFQHADGTFTKQKPRKRKPSAPRRGVGVTDDGLWSVERFGDFTIHVFLKTRTSLPQGRIYMRR